MQNIESVKIKLNFFSEELASAFFSTERLYGEQFSMSLSVTTKNGETIKHENVNATIVGEETSLDPFQETMEFTIQLKC